MNMTHAWKRTHNLFPLTASWTKSDVSHMLGMVPFCLISWRKISQHDYLWKQLSALAHHWHHGRPDGRDVTENEAGSAADPALINSQDICCFLCEEFLSSQDNCQEILLVQ